MSTRTVTRTIVRAPSRRRSAKKQSNKKRSKRRIRVKVVTKRAASNRTQPSLRKLSRRVHTKIPELSSGVSGEVKSVMYNFLSPIDSHDFRWPLEGESSVPTAARTGAVTLHRTVKNTVTGGFNGTYTDGDKGSQLFYIFRNPLRVAVTLRYFTYSSTYAVLFDSNNSTTTSYTVRPGTAPPAPVVYAYATDSNKVPHGLQLFPGYAKSAPNQYFFWFGNNDRLNITVTGTTPSWALFLYKVDQPGKLNTGTSLVYTSPVQTTASTVQYDPYTLGGGIGYYAFTIGSTSTNDAFVAVTLTYAAGDIMCHDSVPGVIDHANYFAQIRLLASSFLLSNIAAPLTQEGALTGVAVNDGTPFYELNTVKAFSDRNDYFPGRLKEGVYTWLRPGAQAFTWRNAIQRDDDTGRITEATFDLDDGCNYQAVVTTANGDGQGNFPALDYLLTYAWALEFRTDDIWRELEFSKCTCLVATQALELTLRAPTFTENPLHIRMVTSFVRNVVNGLRKHSRALGNALAVAFPQYGTSLRLAGQLLQS